MKLTNYIRDAFISSAMNDVPSVDYTEKYRTAVLTDAIAQLPLEVRTIWQNPKLMGYLETHTVYPISRAGGVEVPTLDRHTFKLTPVGQKLCETLDNARIAQTTQRTGLEQKLRSIAYSCTTRKALAEALPEFVKYLPAETETTRNLPVIANVVTDFIKAGWPKGKTA